MALTQEEMEQRINAVGRALIGVLKQYFEATRDDPSTEKDESGITFMEGLSMASYVTTGLVPALASAVYDLDGTSRDELLNAFDGLFS